MRTKRSGEAQTWIFFQLQLARIASNSSPFKAGTESFTYTRAQQYLSTALSESDPVQSQSCCQSRETAHIWAKS